MDNKLLRILDIESEKLSTAFRMASLEGKGTPQEVADRRENAFVAFLKKYFPFPTTVQTFHDLNGRLNGSGV